MKNSMFQWKLAKDQEIPEEFLTIANDQKLHPLVAKLLFERGIQTKEELRRFLKPTIDDLHDPFLLFGMDKVVERIFQAIEQGENILIYGDYDADGITSTTVMKEALEQLGGEPHYYLPNRFIDGYGPNLDVYKYYIENENVRLIITVDNGVSGHEVLSFAKEQGVDVIVTDHHELPYELPEAYAIIHPNHPSGDYPFKELAGVGVAFKVAMALLGEIPMEALDLVAIGTIADLVSLTGENRILVKMGLDIARSGMRLGLNELARLVEIDIKNFDETSIAFQIAPRLNALGRLDDASPGVALMSTFDEEEAKELAQYIDKKNIKRKAIVEKITKEAFLRLEELPDSNCVVLADENWHEGVLGIVAGKIMNTTGKPTVILTIKEDKIAKGSARSIDTVNIFDCLNENSELFTAFGGHHAAAGMSLPVENVEKLRKAINQYIEEKELDITQGRTTEIDEKISIDEISVDFIEQLGILSPFGMDFAKPTFLIENAKVIESRQIGAAKNHLKIKLQGEAYTLDCVAFDMGAQVDEFSIFEQNSFIGKLEINEWNGNRLPQLMVEDAKVEGVQFFDLRGKNSSIKEPNENVLFLLFDEKNHKLLTKTQIANSTVFETIEQLNALIDEKKIEQIVLVDTPEKLEEWQKVVEQTNITRFYLKAQNDEAYLIGLGTREQYAQLFKFIHQYQKVDVRHKIGQMAQYLKIPQSLLVFMLQVFNELGFVEIKDGILNEVKNPIKKELATSEIYQKRAKKMRVQEFLLLENMTTIINYLGGTEK